MANIFEIQDEIWKAYQELEDNNGDMTSEIEEKLSIGEDNLKNKIKSYVGVIKILEADQSLIKEEIERLKSLEKAKKGEIEWLKQTMLRAVEIFGNTDKKGTKYIDYDLGKVSIRTSKVVQVNDEDIEEFTQSLCRTLSWFNMNNQLDTSILSPQDILDSANEERENKFTLEDLKNINAEVKVNVNLESLLSSPEGFNIAKALIKYNKFDIKPKADKTNIKELNKANAEIPQFAEVIDSKSLTIR